MDFTVGTVSRNLATTSNFETVGISHFSRVVRDTWHILSGSRGATCHVQN